MKTIKLYLLPFLILTCLLSSCQTAHTPAETSPIDTVETEIVQTSSMRYAEVSSDEMNELYRRASMSGEGSVARLKDRPLVKVYNSMAWYAHYAEDSVQELFNKLTSANSTHLHTRRYFTTDSPTTIISLGEDDGISFLDVGADGRYADYLKDFDSIGKSETFVGVKCKVEDVFSVITDMQGEHINFMITDQGIFVKYYIIGDLSKTFTEQEFSTYIKAFSAYVSSDDCPKDEVGGVFFGRFYNNQEMFEKYMSSTFSSFHSYESMCPYLKIRFCPDPDTMKSCYIDTRYQEFVNQYTAVRSLTLSEGLTCSIYQIQSGDGVQGYLMMFFKKYGLEFCRTNEYYFFSEALSQSQLTDLKVGDDLTALYDIDPSIYFDLTQLARLITVDGVNDVIYKPLKDGILKLRVFIPEKTDEGVSYDPSDYTIQEVVFYEYGDDVETYVTALPTFDENNVAWLFAN